VSLYLVSFWNRSISNSVVGATRIVDEAKEDDFVVGGYLPNYRFGGGGGGIDLNRTALALTDLYLFSSDLDPFAADAEHLLSHQNSALCCLDSQVHWSKAFQAKAYKAEQQVDNGDLKLWLTVGGGGRSMGLSKLFTTAQDRIPIVAQALAVVCQTLDLHGIDIDYQSGLNRGVERQAFMTFLELLADALHRAGPYLVSTTLRPGMWVPKKVYRVVDRVHVMTYDGPHAPLEQYVKPAIQACLKEKIPPSKMVLGIPAYGRHKHNPNKVMTFAEMYDEAQQQQQEQNNDDDDMDNSTMMMIDTRTEHNGFVFDSPATVRLKAQYAKDMGLKGIFFWELGQDKQHHELAPSGFLLQAAASVLSPLLPPQQQQPLADRHEATPLSPMLPSSSSKNQEEL
jgi:chitinase